MIASFMAATVVFPRPSFASRWVSSSTDQLRSAPSALCQSARSQARSLASLATPASGFSLFTTEVGLNFSDQPTWRQQYAPGQRGLDDSPLVLVQRDLQGQTPDRHLYGLVRDEMGSVAAVTDASSPTPRILARYLHTAYGQLHIELGPELIEAKFDETLVTVGSDTQAPPQAGLIFPGGVRVTTTIPLDPSTSTTWIALEQQDAVTKDWTPAHPATWAIGQDPAHTIDLLLMPKAGWPKGQRYRITLTGALKDGFGRAIILPAGETSGVKLELGAASDGSQGPSLERRFPLRLEEEPAANTLGGAFPGGQTSLYQGLWHDLVGSIAYARNRWLDPKNASWLSGDPLGAVDSPNLYAFVAWQPHMQRDPLGLAGYVVGGNGMREQSASEFYQMLIGMGYDIPTAQRMAIEAGYGPEMGARGAQAAVRGGALASGVFVPMSHVTAYAAQIPAAPLALAGPPGTALMGAWYGFTQKLTENALYNRPSLMQGVGSSTATGGAWGLALGALGKAGGALARTPLAKRLIYGVTYSRVGHPVLQATRRLLEGETMPSILPMGRGPATAGHHTIPVYTGGREEQELVDLFVDAHFGTHEYLDNWSLPAGVSPRSPAPLSYRGEIRPWGRENPYLEIFAAESAANRRYIFDNLRRAYKEYGIYNELSEVFERESAIFVKGGD